MIAVVPGTVGYKEFTRPTAVVQARELQDSLIYIEINYEMIPFYMSAKSCPSVRMLEYRTTTLQFQSNLLSPVSGVHENTSERELLQRIR